MCNSLKATHIKVIILKQLKTNYKVYFSYFKAAGIGYLGFLISEGRELEKWPNYLGLP